MDTGLHPMSYNQQTLIAAPEEEDRVIDSFVQASREINPTVQVTLAKRIVRPGSNKVLCLAARTSVPLNEDEMASVSDLALRLSDGTNVKLSLSFFNDEFGIEPIHEKPVLKAIASTSPCISMSRSFFDPHRYTPYQSRNESKLGIAIFTVVFGIAAGLYFVTESPFSLIKGASLKSALSAAPPFNRIKETAKVSRNSLRSGSELGKQQTKNVSLRASDKVSTPKQLQFVKDAPSPAFEAPITRATHSPSKRNGRKSSFSNIDYGSVAVKVDRPTRSVKASKNMFVPPPPPTVYAVDPSMYPAYMQWQAPMPTLSTDRMPKGPAAQKVVPVQNPLAELQAISAGAKSSLAKGSTVINGNAAVTGSKSLELGKLDKALFDRAAAEALSNSIARGESVGLAAADKVNFERIKIPGQ